ncbi:hypothetical protein LNV09_24645, partial [Paucibacter sp. B2R-40]|uniref:hypothetical protein n=1 Tax=Paucibacter sp. B2R-40 TaxID=2893554 RepID=UPI0021E3B882
PAGSGPSASTLERQMTLDELCDSIASSSSDTVAIGLVNHLQEWKANSANVDFLCSSVERYIGNTWISSESEHAAIYALWSEFRDSVATQIHGMTMNERLYFFGLLSAFDAAATVTEQDRFYGKLHAAR